MLRAKEIEAEGYQNFRCSTILVSEKKYYLDEPTDKFYWFHIRNNFWGEQGIGSIATNFVYIFSSYLIAENYKF